MREKKRGLSTSRCFITCWFRKHNCRRTNRAYRYNLDCDRCFEFLLS